MNELKRATKDLSGTLVDVKSDIRSSVDNIVDDIPSLDDIEKRMSQYVDEAGLEDEISEVEHLLEDNSGEGENV